MELIWIKVILVDVENIGLKELEKINTAIVDKVFVFSKSDAVKLVVSVHQVLLI